MTSRQPPSLPGLYYDPSKKRYFPATREVQSQLKRAKLQEDWKEELLNHENVRLINYESGILEYCDVFNRACDKRVLKKVDLASLTLTNSALERRQWASDRSMNVDAVTENCLSNSDVFLCDTNITVHNFVLLKGYMIDALGSIYDYTLENGNRIKSTDLKSPITAYSKKFLEKDEHSFADIICRQFSVLNHHIFGFVAFKDTSFGIERNYFYKYSIASKKYDTIINVGAKTESVSCAIFLKRCLIFAARNKLYTSLWAKKQVSVRAISTYARGNKPSSDILAMAVFEAEGNLYLGMRDGKLFYIRISGHNLLMTEKTELKLHPSAMLKSIVSLSVLGKNMLLVSALAKNQEFQGLFILTGFKRATFEKVQQLKTKFLNFTKDTEICAASPCGNFICYGKKGDVSSDDASIGKTANFEVFALYETTTSTNNREPITVRYPFATMNDFLAGKFDLKHYKLSKVQFIRDLNTNDLQVKTVTPISAYFPTIPSNREFLSQFPKETNHYDIRSASFKVPGYQARISMMFECNNNMSLEPIVISVDVV
ncbi:uncharacterized protein KNAG_0G01220 [Huiozyma naganishii CBS 8797]|uniref:Uncharacterized protein n=1 Tax=Huiozyma naganishii (strain ATCC MYA-139 / BCRC 22969 / CBS 8797 / KCTC 17520 / NBRC 10181 / NCYC 3082 / Yp74L-3) TaxID=1071383 RepID=J7R8I3_HUIN7|nr:hypothetical protein KNAG_0G01220 [Kazachstania naganishii CBS 8797]CCK71180.1 hypothetical protein KNAG_0G01220 [Kazachstania naganishii CBS 8797]